jgi:hypothetical protein
MAVEPNAPFAMPGGATIGIPVGANPPPGHYLSFRSQFSRGNVVDNSGNAIPVSPDINSLFLSYSYVPGIEILGGTYRFSAGIPLLFNSQTAFGLKTTAKGIGDITISPINVSWVLSPGIFASAGMSFSLATGSFKPDGVSMNLGSGKNSASLLFGLSYLRDGWNLSTGSALTVYAENPKTRYRSGAELLIDVTAMKAVSDSFSIGPVGYWRKQISDDANNGTVLLGGGTLDRAEQLGIGIGVEKRFGRGSLNVNLIKNLRTRNTYDAPVLAVNYSIPIGGQRPR